MRQPLLWLLFALGLLVVGWVAVMHASASPWILLVCLLIALVYAVGGIGLLRYRKATASVQRALQTLPPAQGLEDWLQQQDGSLRTAVRLRILGERVALPAPSLPAYLSGVLVLLGMLGTLLGMMAALQGTGMALDTASDLQAVRDSLAAPVRGLGYAFGTSIAGIATSAVLGLLTALCRRERLQVARDLDAAIAGPLQIYTRDHRQQDSWQLLRQQTEAMPALVARLQALADTIEQRDHTNIQQQQARQDSFHARTEAAYTQLVAGVQQALQASISQAAEASSRALQPVAQATMEAITTSTRAVHSELSQSLQTQSHHNSALWQAATTTIADLLQQAQATQQQTQAALLGDVRNALQQWDASMATRAQALLENVTTQLQTATQAHAAAWAQAMTQQQTTHAALLTQQQTTHAAWAAAQQEMQVAHAAKQQTVVAEWVTTQQNSLAQIVADVGLQAQALLQQMDTQQQATLAQWELREPQRQSEWQASEQQRQAALHAGAQQQQHALCEAMQHTANGIAEHAQQQASATLDEIAKLLQTAAEAPRAAAEVVAELRQSLSDSLRRDTEMLDERNQLLTTLGQLLAAINHASHEQKAAIDALVTGASDLLERTGSRFDARVDVDTQRLDAAATRAAAGAVEVASVGDAFAVAVATFGQVTVQLSERLECLEGALEKSLARSDEQLAYYIAQAREVVDLSLLSQRQIVADLQTLSASRTATTMATT